MKDKTRLVQIVHQSEGRKVAVVQEPFLVLVNEFTSIFQLVVKSLDSGVSIHTLLEQQLSDDKLDSKRSILELVIGNYCHHLTTQI